MTDLTLTHRLSHHLDQVLVICQLSHGYFLRTVLLCRRLFDFFIALFSIHYPIQVLLEFLILFTHISFSLDVFDKFGICKFALFTFAERIDNGFVYQDVESRELRMIWECLAVLWKIWGGCFESLWVRGKVFWVLLTLEMIKGDIIKIRLIKWESLLEMPFNTSFANQKEVVFNCISKLWTQMMIVKPVLTLVALNHKWLYIFRIMRLFAVAIRIEIVLIIIVLLILII